jgi:hypothetical protein
MLALLESFRGDVALQRLAREIFIVYIMMSSIELYEAAL